MKKQIVDTIAELKAEKLSMCKQIKALWVEGFTRKEIIEAGYHKVTVYRQVAEIEELVGMEG